MQFIKRFRVGQRAIKTAISVGLALALAMVLGSSLPIFAAIGAISVMSRTWVDSLKESLNQIAGTFLGYLIACVFVTVLPNPTFFVWMALGVLCVISLCIGLKLNFAIPLASIVFADVCLYTGGDSIVYGFHRFTDTLVGLVVALLVNVVIRPYNNRQKIINMMNEIQKMFLPLLQSRVLEHRYPDLTPLTEKMTSLASELRIFEKQPVALWQHAVRVAARRQEAAYLRGCEQLLAKMCGELAALCNMDSNPAPGELVGILLQYLLRIADTHFFQQLQGAAEDLLPVPVVVGGKGLGDLGADTVEGVETGHWILQYNAHFATT